MDGWMDGHNQSRHCHVLKPFIINDTLAYKTTIKRGTKATNYLPMIPPRMYEVKQVALSMGKLG